MERQSVLPGFLEDLAAGGGDGFVQGAHGGEVDLAVEVGLQGGCEVGAVVVGAVFVVALMGHVRSLGRSAHSEIGFRLIGNISLPGYAEHESLLKSFDS